MSQHVNKFTRLPRRHGFGKYVELYRIQVSKCDGIMLTVTRNDRDVRVGIRMWTKDFTVPTTEGVSMTVAEWDALRMHESSITEAMSQVKTNKIDKRWTISNDILATVNSDYGRKLDLRHTFDRVGGDGIVTKMFTKRAIRLNSAHWNEIVKHMPQV